MEKQELGSRLLKYLERGVWDRVRGRFLWPVEVGRASGRERGLWDVVVVVVWVYRRQNKREK